MHDDIAEQEFKLAYYKTFGAQKYIFFNKS
jgi:hypothetical protein